MGSPVRPGTPWSLPGARPVDRDRPLPRGDPV